MFKQIRDGLRAARVNHALKAATFALDQQRLRVANVQLEKAYALCMKTTFPRMMHIELITFWGLIGIQIRELGNLELADHCQKMSALLQARFDAGDYYLE